MPMSKSIVSNAKQIRKRWMEDGRNRENGSRYGTAEHIKENKIMLFAL